MRYEHIEFDLSTIACEVLLEGLGLIKEHNGPWGFSSNAVANAEIQNVANVLRARLQHTDPDPWARQSNEDLVA
jgi:hypothetical protein